MAVCVNRKLSLDGAIIATVREVICLVLKQNFNVCSVNKVGVSGLYIYVYEIFSQFQCFFSWYKMK